MPVETSIAFFECEMACGAAPLAGWRLCLFIMLYTNTWMNFLERKLIDGHEVI